jgi:transcriptional regulator with XRE-family HTH domain
VATKLQYLRKARGLRILDVTLQTGLQPSTVSSVERGRLAAPKKTLQSLSEFYGIEACELFNENGLAI